MKPVAIFRHAPTEGPGYFATYLSRHGIPWQVVKIDEGEAVPGDPRAFSGLAFMGGPMSVNDELVWLPAVLALIRAAVAADIPTVGHCLGGQLMAKALGGGVVRNPVKEIGWGRVDVPGNAEAGRWFGASLKSFEAFHWHGETFLLPPGSERIASSPYCENQAFVLGRHLGMQFHVEMTPELIGTWCQDWGKEVQSLAARVPSVQTPAEMTDAVEDKVRVLNAVADRLYDRWTAGLKSGDV
ncbi:MAG: glutamine amidotransferase [Betaproteobacteria bacterium RIFCSPLOWO2_12_FULL_62_58]|nr:MAG: glutamine amidotransferase [Betaproteobacteria bacterium RIFCSPLOWO2_12_FULL_62_58]